MATKIHGLIVAGLLVGGCATRWCLARDQDHATLARRNREVDYRMAQQLALL